MDPLFAMFSFTIIMGLKAPAFSATFFSKGTTGQHLTAEHKWAREVFCPYT